MPYSTANFSVPDKEPAAGFQPQPNPELPDAASSVVAVRFDTRSVETRNQDIEHERVVAVHDLLVQNRFAPIGCEPGPYEIQLGIAEKRLMLDVRKWDGTALRTFGLSLTPFRQLIRDYSLICENYYSAIGNRSLSQVEAIDMGRRAFHNEGAELLLQRLKGKVDVDHHTARLLFTLIYVLQTAGSGRTST